MLSNRGADGQTVRIPVDASRDVQASVQDIKDALRSLEAKHAETKVALRELEQGIAAEASKPDGESFTEVDNETVFNSPVTFGSSILLYTWIVDEDGHLYPAADDTYSEDDEL